MKSDKLKKLFLPKAQVGMIIPPNVVNQFQNPQQGMFPYDLFQGQQPQQNLWNYGTGTVYENAHIAPETQVNNGFQIPSGSDIYSEGEYDEYGNPKGTQYNDRLNLINPYGGVGIEAGLAYGAYHAGQGNVGQASLGFGRGLLGMARVGVNSYSKGKAYKEGLQAQDNTFQPNYISLPGYQKGGNITMADLLTGKFITDSPDANVEIEGGEYTYNSQTGVVQEAVGDTHDNGGIPTNLPPQSKVLSDYEKVGKINAKELSKFLDVKVKSNDTYASVLDKYSSKIGVNKNIKDESKLLEKAETVLSKEDNDTKDLNSRYLQKEFQKTEDKKEQLNKKQTVAFQELFKRQEEAKGETTTTPIMQQGGEVDAQQILEQLMSQGMSEEEAIAYMEQQMTQPQGQDIIQQVIQALQQGANPEEVVAFLIEQGYSQEQAVQIIQQASQPQQVMQSGGTIRGVLNTRTQTVRPYTEGEALQIGEVLYYGDNAPTEGNIIMLTDEEVGRAVQQAEDYQFSTTLAPTVQGRTVTSQRVSDIDTLTAEPIQSFTGAQGYGRNVQDVDRFMDTHSWYFNDADKREQFKQAVGTKGSQEQVKAFQEAYNNEIRRRGQEVGLVEDEINKYINEVGFTGDKVQSMDGLFGAYTSSRPIFSTSQLETTPQPTTPEEEAYDNKVVTTPETVNRLRNVIPMLPSMLTMPPSAMQIPRQDQVSFNRITPTIRTPEVSIAQANNQANFAIEQAYANNPNLAPFLAANLLGTTQQSANQAIAETDAYNAQAINQANLYNAQVGDKEQLMNINLNQNFEQRLFGSLANQEADWRRFFTNTQLQQRQNWQDVNNLNLMNQLYPNFQSDGSNMYFSNPRDFQPGSSSAIPLHKRLESMTEKERKEYYKTGKLPS